MRPVDQKHRVEHDLRLRAVQREPLQQTGSASALLELDLSLCLCEGSVVENSDKGVDGIFHTVRRRRGTVQCLNFVQRKVSLPLTNTTCFSIGGYFSGYFF